MEEKPSLSDLMTPGKLSGFQDLQGLMEFHHQPHPNLYQHGFEVQPQTNNVIPVGYTQEQDFVDSNKDERGKILVSEDLAMNCAVTGVDGHIKVDKEREILWQRTKWTEQMVKLLITAVSYIGQYASTEIGRTESALHRKMGKWKIISKLLVERGFHISPQQCEDKFHGLNKKYRRLNNILGKDISCMVVENPNLLDEIDISEKAKEEVKKLLCSKNMFYEEMYSYHNCNQLYLPDDTVLKQSLQLALGKKDDNEPHAGEERDQDAIDDAQENIIESEDIGEMFVFPEVPVTMSKKVNDQRDSEANIPVEFAGFNGILETSPQYGCTDLNPVCLESDDNTELQEQWMAVRSCRLRLQKSQVKAQLLKLEKQRFKWEQKCWKLNKELKKMRLQNDSLKIENERLASELEYRELTARYNLAV